MSARPAALVLARAPRPGECKRELEPLLGRDGAARLQALLIARASAWAVAVAPGRAFVAFEPADALADVGACVPAGVDLFAQPDGEPGERLAATAERVLELAGGRLLIVGTDVPRLTQAHARAALDDLEAGADAAIGPALGGGFYLVGLCAPQPALLEGGWAGGDVVMRTLQRGAELGLDVGLLRHERDLRTPADARWLLADPLNGGDVAAALRR